MKKIIYISIIILVLGIITKGIVDSITTLSRDINNHIWVSFIGRWQCYEKRYYEIEFNIDETFTEYYYGLRKESGYVKIVENQIMLIYNKSSCETKQLTNCTVKIKYAFQTDTLILNIDGKKLSFYRYRKTK